MAETAFSFARDHVFPYLLEVTNMIRGVPKDVADMKKELENIQKMIHDADTMAALGDQVISPDEIKEKVKLLIEVAFRMEDIIDEYMVSEENQPHDPRFDAVATEPAISGYHPLIPLAADTNQTNSDETSADSEIESNDKDDDLKDGEKPFPIDYIH
ncbi:hypothetical protein RJT34_00521 [Clitoria ternatea]|uniref:Disease resistance N-terminal domain-containing protein n=1 Tax=Clitoria ternatea TaxID=43366 RepID=A0AAN9KIF1_CLITE